MPLTKPIDDCPNFARLSDRAKVVYLMARDRLCDHGHVFAEPLFLKSTLFPFDRRYRESDLDALVAELLRILPDRVRRRVGLNNRPVLSFTGCEQTRKQSMTCEHFAGQTRQQSDLLLDAPKHPPPRIKTEGRKEGNGACEIGHESSENKSALQTLRERINAIYKRKETDHWSYAEETALAETARRADCIAELEHITFHRRQMPFDDRKKFFPQSVASLLNKWNDMLDKARLQNPLNPVRSRKPEARSRNNSEMPNATVLRSAIEYQQRNHPNSPMLAMLRKQLETLERTAA